MEQSIKDQVESLDRVLTRLAVTSDDALETVVGRLLPLLLPQLAVEAPPVRNKIMEILAHANKRIKSRPSMPLPLRALADLYARHAPGDSSSAECHPMVRNFALIYLEMAMERANAEERLDVLPTVVRNVSCASSQQRDLALRLAMRALQGLAGASAHPDERLQERFGLRLANTDIGITGSCWLPTHAPARDLRALLARGRVLLLYQPPSIDTAAVAAEERGSAQDAAPVSIGPSASAGDVARAVRVAREVMRALEEAAPRTTNWPPPGLSLNEADGLFKSLPTIADVRLMKEGLLVLTARLDVPLEECLGMYVTAACDPWDKVSQCADDLLRKRCALTSPRPTVDLDSPAAIQSLYRLVLGSHPPSLADIVGAMKGEGEQGTLSQGDRDADGDSHMDGTVNVNVNVNVNQSSGNGESGGASVVDRDAAGPAGAAVVAKALGVLCRSVAAADAFPQALQAILLSAFLPHASPRLRESGMSFTMWVMQHASHDRLTTDISSSILDLLLDTLASPATQGTDAASANLRAFCYEGIAAVARRRPEAMRSTKHAQHVPQLLFDRLSTEPPATRGTLQASLSSLASAYDQSGYRLSLYGTIEGAAQSPAEAARACAVEWAVRLFEYRDARARAVCVMAVSDKRPAVQEAARRGLDPSQFHKTGEGPATPPTAADLLHCMASHAPSLSRDPDPSSDPALPPESMQAMVSLMLAAHTARPSKASTDAVARVLRHAAAPRSPSSVLATAMHALVALMLPKEVAEATTGAEGVGVGMMAAGGATVKQAVGVGSAGATADAMTAEQAAGMTGSVSVSAIATVSTCDASALGVAREWASRAPRLLEAGAAATDPAVRLRVARAAGVALAIAGDGAGAEAAAAWAKARAMCPAPDNNNAAEGMKKSAFDFQTVDFAMLAGAYLAAACAVLGGEAMAGVARAAAGATVEAALSALSHPRHAQHRRSALSAISAVAGAGMLLNDEVARVATALSQLVQDREGETRARVARCLGMVCMGDADAAMRPLAPDSRPLLHLACDCARGTSDETVRLAAGQAMCLAFGCPAVTPRHLLAVDEVRIDRWGGVERVWEGIGNGTPPPSVTPTPSDPRTSSQSWVLSLLLQELPNSASSADRECGCAWLHALVRACGPWSRRLRDCLVEVQEVLGLLVGEPSDVASEAASRAMSMVYALGDGEVRSRLVSGLADVLSGKARQRVAKVDADSAVMPEGEVSRGGQGLTTYRELCNMANDMGKPELVYKFMEIVNHYRGLAAARSTAAGLGSVMRAAGEELRPHVEKMLPKLYRHQFDPSPGVQEAMRGIMTTLLDDPKKAISQRLPDIASDLLTEIGGRTWRGRESVCLALADLVQGRRWQDVSPFLTDAWLMAGRAMDDVKDSVRVAGLTLHSALTSLSVRLATPGTTGDDKAVEQSSSVLSCLLDASLRPGCGLASSAAEVRVACVMTMARLLSVCGAQAARQHLSQVVPSLLDALSGMEDPRLSYLEMQATHLGAKTAGAIDAARVRAAQSTPMAEALDLCARYADRDCLDALVPKLTSTMRKGVGLNTRVGAARFVQALAARQGADLAHKCGHLMKGAVEAARGAGGNAAVRTAMAATVAAVAKHAKAERLSKFADDLLQSWEDPTNTDARVTSALVSRALARSAPDAFARIASALAPAAFVGRFDGDALAARLSGEAWEEGTGGGSGAVRAYLPEIVAIACSRMHSQARDWRLSAMRAIKAVAEEAPRVVGANRAATMRMARAVEGDLSSGITWDGKEEGFHALAALCAAAAATDPAALMEETLTNDDNKHVDGGNASGNASGDVEMADGADAGAGAGGSAGGGASTATLAIADDDRASLAVRAVRACVAGSRKRRRAFRAAALSALARVMGSVREGGERAAGAAGEGTRAALRECAEGLVEGTLRPAMAAVGAEEGSGGGGGGGGNAGGAGGGSTGGGGTEGAAADEGGHAPLAEGLEAFRSLLLTDPVILHQWSPSRDATRDLFTCTAVLVREGRAARAAGLQCCAAAMGRGGEGMDADSLRGLLCGGLWAAVGDVGSAAVRQAAVELVGACVGACGGATVAAAMGGEGGQRLRDALALSAASERVPSIRAKAKEAADAVGGAGVAVMETGRG